MTDPLARLQDALAGRYMSATPHTNYDISPDGKTFAMVRLNPSSRIMVIQNLPELVRRTAGGGEARP